MFGSISQNQFSPRKTILIEVTIPNIFFCYILIEVTIPDF